MGTAAAARLVVPDSVVDALTPGARVEYAQPPRGALGIGLSGAFTDTQAASLGLDRAVGALVVQLWTNGPAHAAGIRVEDVIVEFDGTPVASGRELAKLIGDSRPGEHVTIIVIRGGKRMTLRATIREPAAQMSGEPFTKVYPDEPDMSDDALDMQFGEAADKPAGRQRKGVRIDAVRQGGIADKAGLRSGDRIVRIDGIDIATEADAIAALKGTSNPTHRIVIVRDDGAGGGIEQLVFITKSV